MTNKTAHTWRHASTNKQVGGNTKSDVETTTEDSGVKEETEVAKDTTALDYGRHMEVNVNGQQYSGHPLVVPTNLVETVKSILFNSHGVTPNE